MDEISRGVCRGPTDYTRDVERFIIPYPGPACLYEFSSRRPNAVFAEIATVPNRFGQPTSASTPQHIRTTLEAPTPRSARA